MLSNPDVFVPNVKGEWIHPDAQPVEALMQIAKSCPSGAIRVLRNAPAAEQAPSSDDAPIVNSVRVRENGPLAIEAELLIGGAVQASPRATLCRCGQSQNKPFCDGSHSAAGFAATGEPATLAFEALEVRNGQVDVQPLPNGPLRIVGTSTTEWRQILPILPSGVKIWLHIRAYSRFTIAGTLLGSQCGGLKASRARPRNCGGVAA